MEENNLYPKRSLIRPQQQRPRPNLRLKEISEKKRKIIITPNTTTTSEPTATTTTNLAKNSLINQKWIKLMETDENFRSKGGKKLSLRGCDLKPIDPDLFKLDLMLTTLELSPDYRSCLSHKLDTLPHTIGNLIHLRELKLDTNDLKYLPSELAQLIHLERLCLSNNALKSLPDSLSNLKALKSLHLAKNMFERIPLCIYEMSSLVFLDFTSNKLIRLDEGLVKLARTLKFLSVFDNYITNLDPWIGLMVKLEQFWFGCNKINVVPLELCRLEKIDWADDYFSIILDGNPIDKPPVSICRVGLGAIQKWYQDVDQTDDSMSVVQYDKTF